MTRGFPLLLLVVKDRVDVRAPGDHPPVNVLEEVDGGLEVEVENFSAVRLDLGEVKRVAI